MGQHPPPRLQRPGRFATACRARMASCQHKWRCAACAATPRFSTALGGFYKAFFHGDYTRERLLDGLGETYLADRISLKPWPSCRHVHGTLTAVVSLMEQHDLKFADIEQVTVHVGDINRDRCKPLTTGMNRVDLLCNLPFAVGAAILHRGPATAVVSRLHHGRHRDP